MKRNVSVVRFKFRCNIHISGKIILKNAGFGSEWDTLYNNHLYRYYYYLYLPVHLILRYSKGKGFFLVALLNQTSLCLE